MRANCRSVRLTCFAARVRFSAMVSYLNPRRWKFGGENLTFGRLTYILLLLTVKDMSSSLQIAAQCCCSLLRRVRLEHGLRE
jgi:hypothetical protein